MLINLSQLMTAIFLSFRFGRICNGPDLESAILDKDPSFSPLGALQEVVDLFDQLWHKEKLEKR